MKTMRPSSVPRKKWDSAASADGLSAEILAYLAGDPDRLMRFFDLTGLTPQSLRRAAAQKGFLASLVDYLASDERLMLGFSAETGRDPAEIEAVRQSLAPTTDGGT